MPSKGAAERLVARRERARLMLSQGRKPAAVAAVLGVTERTIRRWREPPKPPRADQRPPGRPPRLAAEQLKQLDRELRRGAFEHGYAGDYWTLDRIGQVIWQHFRIRYHPSGVWHLLRRMGWSCQKVQRRSLARHDDAVAHWRRYIWPQIKKVRPAARQAAGGR